MKVNNIQVAYNASAVGRPAKNVSFKGFTTAIGNANRWAMQYLERGGFFAEFCLMDMCGLVLPRVYQGFQRNKKELGHLNYQAGFEELIREGTTGPSMFLIPIAAVILAGKSLGKATQINFNLLEKFAESFKSLGERFATADVAQTQKAFASNLFDQLFTLNAEKMQHPATHVVKPLENFRESFIEKLTANIGQKLSKNENGKQLGSFVDLVADINVAHFNRENTFALSMMNGEKRIVTTASDLFLDARKYMEDVIPSAKLTFTDIIKQGKTITKKVFDNAITSITNVRHNGRELLCLGGTAALAAFLCIIPKIYQLSKKNPALNGFEEKDKKHCKGVA